MAGPFSRRDVGADVARRRLEQLSAHLGTHEGGPPSAREPAPVTSAAPGRHAARPIARQRRIAAGVGERLPARWSTLVSASSISSGHVGVLALLAAAAVALTAWWLVGARAEPVGPTQRVELATVPAPSIPVPSTDPTTATAELIVDVAGKVRHPGIVTLPAGSRVADAIDAAGGARPGIDLASLNLARLLIDGEQVLVGFQPVALPPGSSTDPLATPGVLINLNTATMEQLDTLPGVGPVTAQAILDWRTENGSFSSVDELLEVDGIGDVTLADLRDLVTV